MGKSYRNRLDRRIRLASVKSPLLMQAGVQLGSTERLDLRFAERRIFSASLQDWDSILQMNLRILENRIFAGLVLAVALFGQADLEAQRRPVLYNYPENPGPNPLEDVRKEMLGRFDADQNGFLDRHEREAIRQDHIDRAAERAEEIRQARRKSEEERRPPKRWLELYDKNNNQRFDGGEWEFARKTEIARVTKEYDSDKNGAIDEEEKATIISDLETKKYNGYDSYIRRQVGGVEERRGEERSRGGRRSRWRDFDLNKDGKADPSELMAIRAHEAKTRTEGGDAK